MTKKITAPFEIAEIYSNYESSGEAEFDHNKKLTADYGTCGGTSVTVYYDLTGVPDGTWPLSAVVYVEVEVEVDAGKDVE